jgi:hypothetical protein
MPEGAVPRVVGYVLALLALTTPAVRHTLADLPRYLSSE